MYFVEKGGVVPHRLAQECSSGKNLICICRKSWSSLSIQTPRY